MDVSIIILNYKQCGLTEVCVKGILSSNIKLKYEVIVVDNNSNDNCLKKLSSEFPDIITIQSDRNRGFAAGNNIGIKKARGKYVAILNPDIALVPGVIEKLFEYLEKNQNTDVCAPQLIYPGGDVQYSCRRFPELMVPIYRRTILGKLPAAKKVVDRYLMTDKDHNSDFKVDWLFGAFLFIRKSIFEKTGLFDENFFLYFEDLDLCRRITMAGHDITYLGSIKVVHYHHQESAQKPGVLTVFSKLGRMHIVSGIRYFMKHGVKPSIN